MPGLRTSARNAKNARTWPCARAQATANPHRPALAFVLACVPWLAHAQGFKCRQADGSVSYQDRACAAGSASTAVQTDMSGFDIAGLPGYANLDSSCQGSAKHTVSVCVPQLDASIKRCYQSRLSARCGADEA